MHALLKLGMAAAAVLVTASPALAGVDPCKLLSAAEVQAATKVKVGAVLPDTSTSAQIGKCKFLHADKSFGSSIVASVAVYKPDQIASQKQVWTTFFRATPVPGVADLAFYNEAGSALWAARGGKAVQIQMLDGPAGAGRLEAIKTLARAALAKL